MNKMNKCASALLLLALVVGAFNMPTVYTAQAQSQTDSFDFGDFSFNLPNFSAPDTTGTDDAEPVSSGFDFSNIEFGNNPTPAPSTDTQTSNGFNFPDLNLGDGFNFPDFNLGGDFNFPDLDLGGDDDGGFSATSCSITATDTTIFAGGSVTLNFEADGFDTVTINGQVMDASSGSYTIANVFSNTTYALAAASAGNSASACAASVTIICLPPPIDCRLQLVKAADRTTAHNNETVNYTLTIKNVGNTDCTNVKVDDVLNGQLTYLTQSTSNNLTAGYGNFAVYTTGDRTLRFNAGTLTPGEQGTITVGARITTPTACGTYTTPNQARASASELGSSVNSNIVHVTTTINCPGTLTPSCDSFTASPNNIVVGNAAVLAWQTTNVNRVVINNGIGDVTVDGSVTVTPTNSTTYLLTAYGANNTSVNCSVPVTVAHTSVFSCPNNVSFSASDSSIRRGDDSVLSWSTNSVDSVSINPEIGATSLSGSRSVEPNSDTTYTLVATRNGQSINCPLTINVTSGGGGGGGSKTPRCELTISDNKIRSGEQVTLEWESTNATDLEIEDNHGKTLVDTDEYNSSKKKDYFDGSMKLRPTRDTEYTLTVERGSKDRVCKVKVNVEDLKVITDRQPIVAGISLSNVPYTGFEAGPFLTIVFYLLLIAWALFVTYLIVVRRKAVMNGGGATIMAGWPASNVMAMREAGAVRPDLFPAQVVPSTISAAPAVPLVPTNLPIAAETSEHNVNDGIITELENRAHTQMALLSSDAFRHFIATTEGSLERNEALDQVIAEAKAQYPLEDGWIVINEARMQNLCTTCLQTSTPSESAPFVPAVVPEGSSSLAEAIVTGNVVAAYEMIGNRPMFALADAAADLDAVVRQRRGESTKISDLLAKESAPLSDEKIKNMIAALTGALDGTYTDEASAVKMAIMKAVKEAA